MKPHLVLFVAILFCSTIKAQQNLHHRIEDRISFLQNDQTTPLSKKLHDFYLLKKEFEDSGLVQDSLYAHILHRIGSLEFLSNKNFDAALSFTSEAIKINTRQGNKGSPQFAVLSYFNMGYYYENMLLFRKALNCYDSSIKLANNFPQMKGALLDAMLNITNIFFREGDYQKSVEESTVGIHISLSDKDSIHLLKFLNQRSQALFFQNKLDESLSDANNSIILSASRNQPFEIASAFKMKGFVYARKRNFLLAESLYTEGIKHRINSKEWTQVAGDFNDFGNFFLDSLNDFFHAKSNYLRGIEYAKINKDSVTLARIYANLGNTFFEEKEFETAQNYYAQAFDFLKLSVPSFFLNPPSDKTDVIGNKELLIFLFKSKTELLLNFYLKNHNTKYLAACLQTAAVTDSVITQSRHEQTGEQSKLYWRDNTRDFFANAIEASYLANDAEKAFYFMEKSRAVLLNDKLNELGASAFLPSADAANEENLQANIIEQEQKLSLIKENAVAYSKQQILLLNAKTEFENFIKTLEQKYPQYYQYKYADNNISLTQLQKYLSAHQQCFVHYFISDSAGYMLGITGSSAKFLKISAHNFSSKNFSEFVQICSDKELLNDHYDSFASRANRLFLDVFQPLQIPKGRVIICPDNFFIPFEALCYDKNGRNFLVNDYAFSYVYSARYLMKNYSFKNAEGNFLGIAPVNFSAQLDLPDLIQSDEALHNSAKHYSSSKLMTNEEASHKNFMALAANYSVVNIFSHAHADSANEPCLYMQDSVVHLSELQLLNDPSTQLIVLSACQTNVGKNATGEGIYSLARGFAAAGIPSVAATLWKADDQMIYSISEKFHEYLSEGMPKDVALQKAKLYFMQNSSSEKLLPYYWANMVLAGNAEPLKLSNSSESFWWIVAACAVLAGITFFMLRKRRPSIAKYLFKR